MRADTDDKIVLISNYTETLDVIERLLNAKRLVKVFRRHSDADLSLFQIRLLPP